MAATYEMMPDRLDDVTFSRSGGARHALLTFRLLALSTIGIILFLAKRLKFFAGIGKVRSIV